MIVIQLPLHQTKGLEWKIGQFNLHPLCIPDMRSGIDNNPFIGIFRDKFTLAGIFEHLRLTYDRELIFAFSAMPGRMLERIAAKTAERGKP